MKCVLIALVLLSVGIGFPVSALAQYFEHSYALVIGIDSYQSSDQWPTLNYAVKDGEAISSYLRSQGYTDIITLYNQQATKHAILAAMQNRIAPRLKPNDRVLVFFAGHGYTESLGRRDRGYIVPWDAAAESAGYVSMEEIHNQSSYMDEARHQLFIMDSCYGGLLTSTRGSMIKSSVPAYLEEASKRYARLVITAGGKDQQVLDAGPNGHSFFVSYLLEALRDGRADLDGDGYITFEELAAYLTTRAANKYQTPSTGVLPGHGGGQYWFKTSVSRVATIRPDVESSIGTRRSGETTPAEDGVPRVPLSNIWDAPRHQAGQGQSMLSQEQGELIKGQNAQAESERRLIAAYQMAKQAQKWQDAEYVLKQLVTANSTRWEYQKALGDVEFNLAQYQQAIEIYEKAIHLAQITSLSDLKDDSDRAKAAIGAMLTTEGSIYIKLHKNKEAIGAFTKATESAPNHGTMDLDDFSQDPRRNP